MATIDEEGIAVLNDLIQTCKDGERGFREAAESASAPELKALFEGYAVQRARFAEELQSEVNRFGGAAERGGSVPGALHRGWINVKSALTGRDDEAVIEECERGEDAAVRSYEKALAGNLPAGVREIVERQCREVKEAHGRVRSLLEKTGRAR